VPEDAANLSDAVAKASASHTPRIRIKSGHYDIGDVSISAGVHIFGTSSRDKVVLRGSITFQGDCAGAVLDNVTVVGTGCCVQVTTGCMGSPTIRFCDLHCHNDAMWIHSSALILSNVIHDCYDCGINGHPSEASAEITIEQNDIRDCGTAVAVCRSVGKEHGCAVCLHRNHIHSCKLPVNVADTVTGCIRGNRLERNGADLCSGGPQLELLENDEEQPFPGVGQSPEQYTVLLTLARGPDGRLGCTNMAGEEVAQLPAPEGGELPPQRDLLDALSERLAVPAENLAFVLADGRPLESLELAARAAAAPEEPEEG